MRPPTAIVKVLVTLAAWLCLAGLAFAVTYTVTFQIDPSGSGSVVPPTASGSAGSTVGILAVPNAGYVFDHWEGGVSGPETSPSVNVLMDANKTITAHFTATTYTLTKKVPDGHGKITLSPTGGSYKSGKVVTVTAVPDAGYKFDHWAGAATGSTNPTTVTMTGNLTVKAYFVADTAATYKLRKVITPLEGGKLVFDPPGPTYPSGTVVTVTAEVKAGYLFDRWGGAASGTTNPITVTMDGLKTIKAFFSPTTDTTYKLARVVNPVEGGTITLTPPGPYYITGASVTVRAVAAAGYKFDHWGADASGSTNPATVTMDAAKTVKAVFVADVGTSYKLSKVINPVEGGTITFDPVGPKFPSGTSVTVRAQAASGYKFDHWGGAASGSTNPVTVTMDAAKTVKAVFVADTGPYTLTKEVQPTGSGTIAFNPAGPTYPAGTQVTLTATPIAGFRFDHWEGGTTGTTSPVQITVSASTTVRAVFVATTATYTLTVNRDPAAGGSVTLNPAGGSYSAGATVTLTPVAASGYHFEHWGGDATGSANPLSLLMSANKTVTAYFVATATTYSLTVNRDPAAGGSVTVSPPSGPYASGTQVSLTPVPNSGWRFDHWGGDATGSANPLSLVMSANKTVTACFTAVQPATHFPRPADSPLWVDFQGRVTICGVNAEPGDEVGVFDARGVLCGRFAVSRAGDYGWLHVYGDDPATPECEGAGSGSVLTFKLWDASAQQEYTARTVGPPAQTPPRWTQSGDQWQVDLEGNLGQDIPLHRGWNLISFSTDTCYYSGLVPPQSPMLPSLNYRHVRGLDEALSSIAGGYTVVRGYDGGARTFDPLTPQFNDLDYLAPGYGYWIKATQDCVLSLPGNLVAPQAELRLTPGLHLVGCWADHVRYCAWPPAVDFASSGGPPRLEEVGCDALFPGLPLASVQSIRGFDIDGGHTLDPAQPYYNDLYYSGPGYGYWFRLKNEVLLSY